MAEMKLLKLEADWCQPCKQMGIVMESVNMYGLQVEKIDISQDPSVAVKYKVRSVPHLILVDDSDNEISRLAGLVSQTDLQNWLDTNASAA